MSNKLYHLSKKGRAACGAKVRVTPLDDPLATLLSFLSLPDSSQCRRCRVIADKQSGIK